MSWTDDQLDKLREKVGNARRNGAWLSSLELGIVMGLISWWRRMTMRSGYRGPSEGLPPTIADMRGHGITHIFITCQTQGCSGGMRHVALSDLHMAPGRQPLPDHAAFIDIQNLCRFRCVRCGGRHVTIMADWPDRGHGSEERARRREQPSMGR